jgi:hypothetical protein
MTKKVLIANYYSPLHTSIGARRWAKFAKMLSRRGWYVHFLCSNESAAQPRWISKSDVASINIHPINFCYPKILAPNPRRTPFSRAIHKLARLSFDYTRAGFIQDTAFFARRPVTKAVETIVASEGIRNVISSGPPHRLSYFIARLKNELGFRLLVDIRDTWHDAKVYPTALLRPRDIAAETLIQGETLRSADKALFVYQKDIEACRLLYPDLPQEKLLHIPQYFDWDDYPSSVAPRTKNDGIVLYYGGSIVETCFEGALLRFITDVSFIRNSDPSLFSRLTIKFFVEPFYVERIRRMSEDHGLSGKFLIHPAIPEKAFLEALGREAHFVLLFQGTGWEDYPTTKSTTLLPTRRPLIAYSEPGILSEMIHSKNLGYVISGASPEAKLADILTSPTTPHLLNPASVATFSYDRGTDALERLLMP